MPEGIVAVDLRPPRLQVIDERLVVAVFGEAVKDGLVRLVVGILGLVRFLLVVGLPHLRGDAPEIEHAEQDEPAEQEQRLMQERCGGRGDGADHQRDGDRLAYGLGGLVQFAHDAS